MRCDGGDSGGLTLLSLGYLYLLIRKKRKEKKKKNKRKKDWPVEKFENFGTKIYLYSTFNYKETIN